MVIPTKFLLPLYLSQSIDDGKSSVQIKYVDATKIMIVMAVMAVTPILHVHGKEILSFLIMICIGSIIVYNLKNQNKYN